MTKTKTKKKAKTEARADKRSGILDQARRAALMEELGAQLYAPPPAAKVFETEEKVRERFALPVTLGTTEEVRLAQDAELADTGLYSTIYKSLQQHGYELGQYPTTSFIGYGALQQIAQNGMIRACVQTVSDDITREWIQITGSDDGEKVDELQKLQEKKYHLRGLFHEAATITGYMGGAFIFIDTGEEKTELPLRINDASAELVKGGTLRFVVVDPVSVSPGDYNSSNPLKADYMRPKWYWVLGQRVHASRMIPLYDTPPADASPARIQLPWNPAGANSLGLRDALEPMQGVHGGPRQEGLASGLSDEHGRHLQLAERPAALRHPHEGPAKVSRQLLRLRLRQGRGGRDERPDVHRRMHGRCPAVARDDRGAQSDPGRQALGHQPERLQRDRRVGYPQLLRLHQIEAGTPARRDHDMPEGDRARRVRHHRCGPLLRLQPA